MNKNTTDKRESKEALRQLLSAAVLGCYPEIVDGLKEDFKFELVGFESLHCKMYNSSLDSDSFPLVPFSSMITELIECRDGSSGEADAVWTDNCADDLSKQAERLRQHAMWLRQNLQQKRQ